VTFETIAETDDPEAARAVATSLPMIIDETRAEQVGTSVNRGAEQRPMDIKRIVGIAEKNPKLFAKEVLPRVKENSSAMLPLLGDEDLRALLKEEAPEEWAELVDKTPMLKLFAGVESRFRARSWTRPPKS
jgi:hypothetical protein